MPSEPEPINPLDFGRLFSGFRVMTPDEETTYAAAQEAERRRLQAEREGARLRNFEKSLPPALRWARIDAPELGLRCPFPNQIARARALSGARRVVFVGGAGKGKTSLAVALLRLAFESRKTVCFVPASRLGTVRIQTQAGHGEAELVTRALSADVTLIDDLGIERHTANNAVPDVIIERHLEDRATWVTTGLTSQQIGQRYGDGVRRRIVEGAIVIPLGAPLESVSGERRRDGEA